MIQNILAAPSQINTQNQEVNLQPKTTHAYSATLVANETKPSEDRVNISREAQSRFQQQQQNTGK